MASVSAGISDRSGGIIPARPKPVRRAQEIIAGDRLPRAVAREKGAAARPRCNGVSSLTSAGSAARTAEPVPSERGRGHSPRSKGADFGSACATHWPALRRYALSLTHDPDRAEDLVQDTFARALTKRHLFRDGTDLAAWLIHMLHNLHVSGVRAALRRGGTLDVAALAPGDLAAIAVPALQLRVLEARDALGKFARLGRHHRDALRLAADGVPYEGIAHRLGLPLGTVKSRLGRGRARLRALIDGRLRRGRAA